jgi:putative ABC transport system permease protein
VLLKDVRYAVRALWKRPGFTSVAVLTLALGIGANTAIFSVVNAVLLSPLPYEDPERIVAVWERQVIAGLNQQPVSLPNYEDWRQQSRSFGQLAASRGATFNLTVGEETVRVAGARVSTNLYSLLGAKPVLGRHFLEEEGRAGAQPVALVSYGLWQRVFGSDPRLVGKAIRVDGNSHTVVGVLPGGLNYPASDTDLIIPFIPQGSEIQRSNHFARVLGRLRPGVPLSEAHAEMDTIAARLEQQYPDSNTGYRVQLVPLFEQLVGNVRTALLVLLGAVGCVLLISCVNVTSLMLARGAGRRTELSVRAALGASRSRLVRQLLIESVVLSLCGGLIGLLLAFWGVPALIGLSSGSIPRADGIGVSYEVLGFTLLTSLVTGALFGIAPALQSTSSRMVDGLREGRRGSTGGLLHRRVLGVLVVSEIAMALVLLVGAGLLIRSFLRLRQVSPGYDPKGTLTAGIGLSPNKYPELRHQVAFYEGLLERLGTTPGITSAALVSKLPVLGFATSNFTIQGSPVAAGHAPTAHYRVISPGYFKTMGIPFAEGRDFSARDRVDTPDAVIINKSMAERFWPGASPLGKRIQLATETTRWREIVGVVGDEKLSALDTETGSAVYVPLPQNTVPTALRSVTLVVKAGGDISALPASVRQALRAMDGEQALFQVRPLEEVISDSLSRHRFNSMLMVIFAGLAGLLAAVGVYGVLAYSVAQRRQEIGVRMALGARPFDVLKMVLGQGMKLSLAGIAAGLVTAVALTRVASSLLYGVSPTDPLTFLIISLILIAVAFVACYFPARRATRVDPCVALRHN